MIHDQAEDNADGYRVGQGALQASDTADAHSGGQEGEHRDRKASG